MENSSVAPSFDRPTLDSVMAQIADVDGWLTPGQASTLYDSAVRCPQSSQIVEIGSFHGRSTIVLASAADPSVQVVAIDPHAGNDRGPKQIDGYADEADGDHAIFNRNLADAGLAGRVRHLRLFSNDAHEQVVGDIGLIYVDGSHRYASARGDIASWGARVADSGTLLIHDSFSSIGVTLAILRELSFGSKFRYVARSRSMAIYRADLGSGSIKRVKNGVRQLAQLPWFMKNLGLKVLLTAGLGEIAYRAGRTAPEWPY